METLLAFHLSKNQMEICKKITDSMHVAFRVVKEDEYKYFLKDIVVQKKTPFAKEIQNFKIQPSESLLFFCNIEDKKFDMLLVELRKQNINVSYKAVMTSINQNWNFYQLISEMRKEKMAYLLQNMPRKY